MSREEAKRIDVEKIRIEAIITPRFKTIFNNIARDAERLYKTTNTLPSQELAENYYPEFVKEIRDAMRKTIKSFGFDLRKALELKGFNFDVEFKSRFIDLDKKLKITDENLDPKLEEINNEFLVNTSLFVANQSEAQASFITQTNAKEIQLAVIQEQTRFKDKQENNNEQSISASQIANEIQVTSQIAQNLKINLFNKVEGKVALISAQVVGLAEAWSRQEEARLINKAKLKAGKKTIKVLKTWWAILDLRTRASHAQADQQQVGVNENFIVDGESLKYPRDPNGSLGNIINCRCVSLNEIDNISKRDPNDVSF
jgi:hypothetical protein